ncbi:MAG TPA: hypothetical protein VMU87_21085 [Stellaceae bacterium]|nr:hypothetical protein [Stellaceae bacterium]
MELRRHVAAWLTRLAGLTEAKVRPDKNDIADRAEILARHFPHAAFTTESLDAVATGLTWWPALDVIRNKLAEWWQEHGPKRLYADDQAGLAKLSDEAQAWVRGWQDAAAQGAERLAHYEKIFRHQGAHVDVAIGYLIAIGAWRKPDPRYDAVQAALKAEWDDPAGILGKVAALEADKDNALAPMLLGMLAALVKRHAPQHLGLLPPAVLVKAGVGEAVPAAAAASLGSFATEAEVVRARMEAAALPQPKPSYLTPEQLARHRAERPLLVPLPGHPDWKGAPEPAA